MDRNEVAELLTRLDDDLNRSISGRNRLTLITTMIGVIGLALWSTTIYLIVQLNNMGCV